MATIRAASLRRLFIVEWNGILRQSIISWYKTVFIAISTLVTPHAKMRAHKGVGHASGWNSKRFHNKGTEQKSQNKSGYQPFKGVGDVRGPISSRRFFTHILFVFSFSHKPFRIVFFG